ncbi:MAG: class I SAM-dependent methyltransferase [Alphaproteobacteria bacterium]|nr:class I SAM-dependent methyltransferase [Alphaproteobacteria bacterium]MBF0129325.1 class I SAM-dependent methyltransferase [Alphaproteobacteria bacterium]
MTPETDPLAETRTFWNASPCSGQSGFTTRYRQRYAVEPWIPSFVKRIAAYHSDILEVGCGQGTDGLLMCQNLPPGGRYVGVDYSDVSVAQAKAARAELGAFPVEPEFRVGNAEQLDIPDNSVECVYSLGVLHHTADDRKAFAEVRRVLRPGGFAYIVLYRKWSAKVAIAKALRGLQRFVDRITGTERTLYRMVQGRHMERVFGTMLLECFGVPYMNWYDRADMYQRFRNFDILALYPMGYNIPYMNPKGDARNPLGYFWVIELRKPPAA